jgi:hypothetical protein
MDHDEEVVVTDSVSLPRIHIPPYVPPTPEQLRRWKELADEADRIRAEIGPVDIRADELLHLARAESGE